MSSAHKGMSQSYAHKVQVRDSRKHERFLNELIKKHICVDKGLTYPKTISLKKEIMRKHAIAFNVDCAMDAPLEESKEFFKREIDKILDGTQLY